MGHSRVSQALVGDRMSLFETLDSEARKLQAKDEDVAARKLLCEADYRDVLEPGMDALEAYLLELTNKLKLVQPPITLRCALAGYGDVVAHVEHEYTMKAQRHPSSRELLLSFAAIIASPECPNVKVEGANRVRMLANLFQRYRLGAALAPRKDAADEVVAATFRARGRITLTAKFVAEASTGQLTMSFDNFDGFGSLVKRLPSDQVNASLHEQIGRYLTRQSSDLLREELPDQYRSQLRAKVQHDEVRRRWEEQISARQANEVAQLRREYGFGGRVTGRLRDLMRSKRAD